VALREILAFFGIEVDDKQLKGADKSVDNFNTKLQKLGQALASGVIVKGFTDLVGGTIESAAALKDASERLGVSAQELQKFQFAGQLAGVSAEEMGVALKFLNKNLGEASDASSQQAKDFAALGIAVRDTGGKVRPASDVFLDVANKVNGMGSQAEKTAGITKLLGKQGANLLPLFSQGAKGVEEAFEQFKKLGIEIDQGFLDQADEVDDQITVVKLQFESLKTKLVATLMPAIKTLTEFLSKLVQSFQKLVLETNIAKVVMVAFAGLAGVAAVTGLGKLASALGSTSEGLLALGIEGAIIVAVVALIALAVEDLYTLFTGGQSVIGDFVDSMFGVGSAQAFVDGVTKAATELWEALKTLGPPLSELGGMLVDAFKAALPIAEFFIKNTLASTVPILRWMVDGLIMFIAGLRFVLNVAIQAFGYIHAAVKFLIDLFAKVGEAGGMFTNPFKGALDLIQQAIAWVDKLITKIGGVKIPGIGGLGGLVGGGSSPVTAAASTIAGAASGSVAQDNKVNITVQGGGDAQSTAKATANALGDVFETQKRNAMSAISGLFS
jgi:hypothetical protein